MDCCDVQKNAATVRCEEEMGGSTSQVDLKSVVVCPKPRKVGCLVSNPSMITLRRHRRTIQELCDSKGRAELFDMILAREANAAEKSPPLSPQATPYFSGSPPSRVPNPLVLDSHFKETTASPSSPLTFPSPSSPTLSPSARKGGCARLKFGLKQAAVRVEGFDCLSRDRQSSSLTAVA